MARFSVNIPDELHEILQVESKRRGLSVAGIVRELLLKHYEYQFATNLETDNAIEKIPEKSPVDAPVYMDHNRQPPEDLPPQALDSFWIDEPNRGVWVNGHKVRDLTRLEYELMAYLVKKRGQVCSRDELIQHLYPEDMTLEEGGVADNRLDSLVKRLRKRIEPRPKEPRYIITIRGHGFRLVDNG